MLSIGGNVLFSYWTNCGGRSGSGGLANYMAMLDLRGGRAMRRDRRGEDVPGGLRHDGTSGGGSGSGFSVENTKKEPQMPPMARGTHLVRVRINCCLMAHSS